MPSKFATMAHSAFFLLLAAILSLESNAAPIPTKSQLLKISSPQAQNLPEIVAPELIFNQKIDHFSESNHRTFRDRYYISKQFVTRKDAPVIFLAGEESATDKLYDPVMTRFAQQQGAYLIAIEHRYYGESQPFKRLTTSHLRYLSTEQAIEDMASLQRYAQDQLGMTGKWIVVGGSYSGNLAAFYRAKHPELVVGAIASSAPVFAKADFYEYDRHNAQVASPECRAGIQEATAMIEAELQDQKKAYAIKAQFNATDIQDDVDFLYVIGDVVANEFQYGRHLEFCSAIEGVHGQLLLDTFILTINAILKRDGMTAFQDSFETLENRKASFYRNWPGGADRAWMYQSCTEYGFYQTANPDRTESLRSARITLQFHNDVCKSLFGLTTPVNTEITNQMFYNQLVNGNVTHIFFSSGQDDPWSELEFRHKDAEVCADTQFTFFSIVGGAHCNDLSSYANESGKASQLEFERQAISWLNN